DGCCTTRSRVYSGSCAQAPSRSASSAAPTTAPARHLSLVGFGDLEHSFSFPIDKIFSLSTEQL
ncbi:MAG: hypothetical protein ACXW6J_28110, partial [Candidatus Binatia bacterium]